MAVSIRPVKSGDFFHWLDLFVAYGESVEAPVSDERALIVWSWLEGDESPQRGVVAEDDEGSLIGFAHYRSFPRPLQGDTGFQIDDLFVAPGAEESETIKTLIEHVRDEAKEAGATVIRWMTAKDDKEARKLYDELAERTHWVTYDLAL